MNHPLFIAIEHLENLGFSRWDADRIALMERPRGVECSVEEHVAFILKCDAEQITNCFGAMLPHQKREWMIKIGGLS